MAKESNTHIMSIERHLENRPRVHWRNLTREENPIRKTSTGEDGPYWFR